MERINEDDETIDFECDEDTESDKEIDDFLAELGSDKFQSKPEISKKEQLKQQRQEVTNMKQMVLEQERQRKREMKEQKQQEALNKKSNKQKKQSDNSDDGDDLFSTSGTPILGKERILLLKKVAQYKTLFPEELKGFKVKKNPSAVELTEAIEEMGVLVELGSMDAFMMDSVLQCMKLVESASSITAYDIRGCADMLKNNKEFHKLCKVLFIKYNVFTKVPPEFQMVLLVSTTAFMCSQKNKGKASINEYLNSTI